MLPSDLIDLNKRLEKAIKKHRAAASLRDEILRVAEPQIALFRSAEDVTMLSLGEVHERARKIDPSIPRRLNTAMQSPGLDRMMDSVRSVAVSPLVASVP